MSKRRPEFGAIITISYSAFDDFELPTGDHRAAARDYTYCGLRKVESADDPTSSRLKDLAELAREFHGARRQALAKERSAVLLHAVEPLFQEPSFRTVVELPPINDETEDAWREAFAGLSAGHKIVLNIIVQLCAHIERRSLVLIDEPELHLHPPLVAALLRSIGIALARYSSYGVVATHSPVVLQEVPAHMVKVLRRSFDDLVVEEPEIETFAENVGLLTQHVFNLDSSSTDYQGILRSLAATRSLGEIDALFGTGMSAQARSLVMTLQRGANGRGRE